MDKFAKSILNYFATFTETRFSFQKKIDYKWTDNSLTLEFSVFPKFQQILIDNIQDGTPFNLTVEKGEFSVLLDENHFKKTLLSLLESSYNLEYLNNCVNQARENLLKQENDKVVVSSKSNTKEIYSEIKENPEFNKKVLQEGLRKYNLAFRQAVRKTILTLQEEKKEALQHELRFSHLPNSTFNPQNIEQDIYDKLK